MTLLHDVKKGDSVKISDVDITSLPLYDLYKKGLAID